MSDRDELDRLYERWLLADQSAPEYAGRISREIDDWLARVKAEAAADALDRWIGEWPTHKGDGALLGRVAREGLGRANRIRSDAGIGGGES